jgi:tryptophanyl-tRNA synthetase
MRTVTFDSQYYNAVMKEFGYGSLKLEPISFSLGDLTNEDLQRLWLCHMNGTNFANTLNAGERVIATTGFGMSGIPHAGTLGQIFRMLRLQRSGIPVQIVLGDLDAYNGRNTPLEHTQKLEKSYRKFILNLGFNPSPPNSLRSQYESLSTLRLAYLIGHYMDDKILGEAEEDLYELYLQSGEIHAGMSYSRKLSLNLMVADFLELLSHGGFKAVLVVMGIDEHKYVNLGRMTIKRACAEYPDWFQDKYYSAMYSGVMGGLHGYPKMAKSFPNSGINTDMSAEEIRKLIEHGETVTQFPETNVVYQMIAWTSFYDNDRIKEAYEECHKQSLMWKHIKREYASHLAELCQRWWD